VDAIEMAHHGQLVAQREEVGHQQLRQRARLEVRQAERRWRRGVEGFGEGLERTAPEAFAREDRVDPRVEPRVRQEGGPVSPLQLLGPDQGVDRSRPLQGAGLDGALQAAVDPVGERYGRGRVRREAHDETPAVHARHPLAHPAILLQQVRVEAPEP
jgi:hypothetical protein